MENTLVTAGVRSNVGLKNLHGGLRNTLNNKSIKGKLQTILDLIV